jgi:hypothetical protein
MTVRNLSVEPVQFRGQVVGYRVGGIHRQCSDSLWDPICHRAIFPTPERASRMLARIAAKPSWEWKWTEWTDPHSWEGAYSVI